MLKTLANAWKIAELRKKLIFTLLVLLVYRIGNVIPVPYIDVDAMTTLFNENLTGTIFAVYNTMSGRAFSQASVLALAIQPYINASIIIQLLTIAIPALERLAKEGGEEGKKKIERITRYTTAGLGLLLGVASYTMLRNYEQMYNMTIIVDKSFLSAAIIVLAFAAGASVVMWLGEQITEFGIGNGISMILFANIISSLPSAIDKLRTIGSQSWVIAVIIPVVMLILVLFIVFINDAERRIPIQYAKRVVGRKVYGGQNTNLPIKVAMSGVMPVIFAQSICSLPSTVIPFFNTEAKWVQTLSDITSPASWVYAVAYGLMIFFFSWFYSTIQYDPVEIGNNLKNNGGFIPGFRPGRPTAEFIKKVINKIVIFGAVYLAIIALLPVLVGVIGNMDKFQNTAFALIQNISLGGTSVIIVVGVALETVKALEAQLLMRHYKGFLD